MKNHDSVRAWIRKAEEDRKTIALIQDEGLYDVACFHAQQQAEKMLKAFIIAYDRTLAYTHNLENLLHVCCQIDPSMRTLFDACVYLSPFAVLSRYPNDCECEPDQAEQATKYADTVYLEIIQKLDFINDRTGEVSYENDDEPGCE